MSASIWWWLLAAGVLFWLVGLHNRITRQRARAIEVLGVLEKQVRACAQLVLERHAALGGADAEPVSMDASPQWLDVVAAARQVDSIWGQARKNTLTPTVQVLRRECWQTLQGTWNHLIASPSDLAGAPVPEDFKAAWEAGATKAITIQNALNGIIAIYNEWVQELPACLVARRMGFEISATI